MPADDNVLDLEGIDGEENDGLDGEVVRGDDVGDVAVDEDVTGLCAAEGGFRAARVGAAEPEERGRLALGKSWEKVGILVGRVLVPLFVGGEKFVEGVWSKGEC